MKNTLHLKFYAGSIVLNFILKMFFATLCFFFISKSCGNLNKILRGILDVAKINMFFYGFTFLNFIRNRFIKNSQEKRIANYVHNYGYMFVLIKLIFAFWLKDEKKLLCVFFEICCCIYEGKKIFT